MKTTERENMNTVNALTIGTEIVRGHKVVRMKGSTWHSGSWVVLCEAPEGEHHGWVTWRVCAGTDGYVAESGIYFPKDEYEQAFETYERRD